MDEDTSEAGPSSSPSPLILPLPPLDVRWVHAGAQHLDLLPTPITSLGQTYKAFSADESERIEERWLDMTEEERKKAVAEWGATEGEGAPAKVKPSAKDKEKEKEQEKEKEKDKAKRRESASSNGGGSNVHAHSLRSGEVQDRLDGKLPEKEEVFSGQEQVKDEGDSRYREVIRDLQKNYDLETVVGVPVSQDSMFEVSLPTLSLHPVFWVHSGPRVPVIRGTWFVGDDTKPCSWELAEELEKAYQEIKPWQPSYKDELATAIATGKAAEEKLRHNLPPRFGQGLGVVFDDADSGRLVDTGASYLSRAFWASIRSKSGTCVYRGYQAARAAAGKTTDADGERRSASHSRRGSTSSQRSVGAKEASLHKKTLSKDHKDHHRHAPSNTAIVTEAIKSVSLGEKELLGAEKALKDFRDGIKGKIGDKMGDKTGDKTPSGQQAIDEEFVPVVDSDENDAPCTDLILVIHGIGQQLATQYESYSFVYAGNQLRQVLRKQSANPALASIIRDRRCQVLPVQWRASLDLEDTKSQEDRDHGMDNRFTMADITINKSIPMVRELTNSVLLDIPLYMSHHRQKMIEAVCTQANRLYRLWIARNPGFEEHGRVHIIGHSLGSALAANILSNQSTKMPPLSKLPRQVREETRNSFLFNTHNLFLCGSPLGIFLHLDQTQIMPRRGRERTMNSPQDEALDRSGKFGCMAIDSLYNIFYFTDPIAYQLNAAVDVRLAAKRPPLAITSVTAPLLTTFTEGIGSISRYLPSLPFTSSSNSKDPKPRRPGTIRLPSGIEMTGPSGEERLEGTRAERRFSALNPHGNIDFYLPSAGVSEYLDMITAHASYWADASFAAFLLTEIFSTRMDLLRTGMGLAAQVMPEGTTF